MDNGDTVLNNLSEREGKSTSKLVLFACGDVGVSFPWVDPAGATGAGWDCGTGWGRGHWLGEEEAGGTGAAEDEKMETTEGLGDGCDDT